MYERIQSRWDDILANVSEEHNLSSISVKTWLKPLRLIKFENDTLVIGGELSTYDVSYLQKKYLLPLKAAIAEVADVRCEIRFLPAEDKEEAAREMKVFDASVRAGLNPKYTFDSFVVGSNNKFAHAAALAVAESPGEVYNPLFVYGGVGLGKTHLMHSIAHFILQNNPDIRVLYVTSEDFTNEVINAVRSGNTAVISQFREKYRNVDVLLIDDIQFIVGRESTQEEFFHTFNALHAAHRQIILSSDRPPKEFDILEERIKSRFEWGLMADIQSPDFETRMAILQNKQMQDGTLVSQEVLTYIAENIKSNIRELEGALNKVLAQAKIDKTELTVDVAKKALLDIISPGEKSITPQYVVDVVADQYGLSDEEIKSVNRSKRIAYPRYIAMYLLRKYMGMNLDQIGQLFGGMNHSTVHHGFNQIERLIREDGEMRATIDLLRKKINPN